MAPLGIAGIADDSRADKRLGLGFRNRENDGPPRPPCAPEFPAASVRRAGSGLRPLAKPMARPPAGRDRRRHGLSLSAQVAWSAQCKPHHFRAPYFIKTMGRCAFDQTTLSFHGDGVEQARCLMRGMDETRNLGAQMAMMPAPLADRVGNEAGLPTREVLAPICPSSISSGISASICGCR